MPRLPKKTRHEILLKKLGEFPFMTDEALAQDLNVSVQTIRLDRLELRIPELRERTKKMAIDAGARIKTIADSDVVGNVIDIVLGKSGISMMNVTNDMVFEKNKIAKGHFIYAQANALALAIIDAPKAVTGIANIKYLLPVSEGEKLIAKAEVTRVRGNKYFIAVRTRSNEKEVFRVKFIMVSLEEN